MYTANIISKDFQPKAGRIEVIVGISDGTTTVEKPFYLSLEETMDDLKVKIKAHLDRLESAVVNVSTIAEGGVNLAGVTTDILPDETAFQDWLADYRKLKAVQELVSLGILTGQETAVTNLKTRLSNRFLPAYLTRI